MRIILCNFVAVLRIWMWIIFTWLVTHAFFPLLLTSSFCCFFSFQLVRSCITYLHSFYYYTYIHRFWFIILLYYSYSLIRAHKKYFLNFLCVILSSDYTIFIILFHFFTFGSLHYFFLLTSRWCRCGLFVGWF